MMRVTETELGGLLVFEPRVFEDERGFFLESFQAERYRAGGLDLDFVQDNHSRSRRGVLRGLHFQRAHPQGKLVYTVRGAVYDVAVDLRPGSPTFGCHVGLVLSDENRRQLYVPPGFAHGFCVLSDWADVTYKCTDYYRPGDEGGVRWDDPDLAIRWPLDGPPVLSPKDAALPRLVDLAAEDLPAGEVAA